ncbi:MAG: GNAT family N-acetyltransferase [Filimonas sp.]|nr:GNAT family N-acetyltransferase [Filimonas sp.]
MGNFSFEQDYVLEDNVALLRPLIHEDIENLKSFARCEPSLWRFSLVSPAGEENMKAYIDAAVEARKQHREYAFIVYDKRVQEYAGSTRFYDMQLSNQTLQLGYTWYGERFQQTGLNKHCKYLLLQFAFEQMGMERVEFRADANNEKSIAAMKSIGCTVEGILRSHMPTQTGGRRDSIVLSILKSEWAATVKPALEKRIMP